MILPHELILDYFAGGGGASTGIEAALGRPVDLAVNHSPSALAMHAANHPATHHRCEDVWTVDPVTACAGRPVGLAWFSPDCTHHSRAKGGTPRSKRLRALAWVVIRWARAVHPRVIVLENVEEWATWGPLDAEGQPDPRRAGRTFRMWLGKLRAQGYRVEWRSLVAADYGAPTTRRRLFLIARCDGAPIVWPTPTHGKGRLPWRSAASVIDWSLPCPSIFDRARPLAEATLRRIAAGVRRYVIECAAPFIIRTDMHLSNAGCMYPRADPLRTATTTGGFAVVAPSLIQVGYGERDGQAPRTLDLARPLGTVVGTNKHALVAASLLKHYSGAVGQQAALPLGTVTARDHHALTTVTLGTGADRRDAVRAFLLKYYGAGSQQQSLFAPLHTVTATARFGLVTVQGQDFALTDIGMRMLSPRELFAAQGFPAGYVLAPALREKPLTKTQQIECAGNSVCPPVAEAIVRANVGAAQAVEVA